MITVGTSTVSGTKSVSARAKTPTVSGLYISAGSVISLTASGSTSWTGGTPSGPNGYVTFSDTGWVVGIPGRTTGSIAAHGLLARIGSGPWMIIGYGQTITAAASGELQFLVNDRVGYYGDNSGSLTVSYTVNPVVVPPVDPPVVPPVDPPVLPPVEVVTYRLNWLQARMEGRAGSLLRRAGWVDRYIEWDSFTYLWWIQIYNASTKVLGIRRVVQATDFGSTEFKALDWTFQDVPGQVGVTPISGATPGTTPPVIWR